MKKVTTRVKPDAYGKLVDQITLSTNAFMYVFDADQLDSREDAQLACLRALKEISKSKNKSVRLRDFVLITGTQTNRIGVNCFAICFPENISSQVIDYFCKETERFPSPDVGIYPMGDLVLEPLARYSHGKIVIYTTPSSPLDWLPESFALVKDWDVDWETRSYEITTTSWHK